MLNFENATLTCDTAEPARETAKAMLENMDGILKELGNVLDMIDRAIYSPQLKNESKSEPMDECLLGTLNRQRNTAEELLKIAVHIREGLW